MGLWHRIKNLRSVLHWKLPSTSCLFLIGASSGFVGRLIVFVITLFAVPSFAQVDTSTPTTDASTEAPVVKSGGPESGMTMSEAPIEAPTVPTQVARRADKTISLVVNYGLYSFIVPGKKGAQLTWMQSPSSSWELDYFSGDYGLKKYGINLVSFGERVIVGRYRKYWQSSFNLGMGLGERTYSFELGSRLTENIPGEIISREKLIELKRYVFDFSLGNRWHFNKGFVLSMDWFELSVPFGPGSKKAAIVDRVPNSEDRENTRKVLRYLNYMPTLTFLKVGVGFAL